MSVTPQRYRKDVQGLRAIAVVSVVLFHAFPDMLPGGFVGVDVFFVISGFLITGILYRNIQAGTFTLADFYRRRIRRIFPALLLMLAVVCLGGALLLSPQDFTDLARNTISATLFVSNVDFFFTSGYFDRAAELRPLLHTWSLAVEEQFYIVFPPLLWLVLRFARKWLLPLLAVGFALFLSLSQWALGQSATGAYFLAPFRMYEMLAGSFVAVIAAPGFLQSERLRTVLAGLGLLLIGASLFLIDKDMAFPGVLALPPVLGTGLLLLAGLKDDHRITPLITSKPFLFFGGMSYSLYLWHWPVLAYLRIGTQPYDPSPLATWAAVMVAIAVSWLSFRYIEQPVAHRSVRETPFLRLGLVGMASTIAAAGVIYQMNGLPGRFPQTSLDLFQAAQDYSPERTACHRDRGQDMPYVQTCVLGAQDHAPSIVIWGDSHGVELSHVLANDLESAGQSLRQITASACPPVTNLDFPKRPKCRTANTEILQALAADSSVETVILLTNAVVYFDRWALDRDAFARGYANVVENLSAAGKRVVLVSQIPNVYMEAPSVAGYAVYMGRDPFELGRERATLEQDLSPWRDALRALADSSKNVSLVDPVNALCDETMCRIVSAENEVLYFNPTHVSLAGAKRMLPTLKPYL